ncbi:LLM class flavin-dependent oxidoreductase [Mycetocola reblochoni]|uniref:Coenzyme F420-dependent N5,N10-methylene tetrahydromethanopterin reductase and related flavin-dependent oxidoreductases sulfonate monooxygenase n=2 Tax=Mycetocola reblochoni TaxID=331618 RepID=A0A1R4IUF4_9MICO|nr:LLM class flavin-dependent oxidoreductase [Mycetocola reblochoni]RLP71071.1 LLM class flavin-dependent oxidoreductase [Mycetocola reblochoni]SJN22963.1 Coenzyme F420-dependent N5,N10-methylene tetrahydromethanopterin reductase and related flavin-dependent oxidoreductases; sulfonate monooxygenase [Mycetocola reblochoni REB411]
MRFGYWTPIFGGWLRNVADEQTPATVEHIIRIARAAEAGGFDLTLVPELNLNDIRGADGPALDAWTVAIATAAVTERIEIMAALRPSYHPVALAAKQIATIQDVAAGRFTLNVVSAWWQEEARQYGVDFASHDDRYAYTSEYVEVLRGLWSQTPYSHEGRHFRLDGTHLEPKPVRQPLIYAGGESPAGREAITGFADAYLTHGGTVDELDAKITDMRRRRAEAGREPFERFGMAAFAIVRDTEEEAQAELERITDVRSGDAYHSYQDFVSKSQLDTPVSLRDYSVSNRGLRPELIGTPEQVAARIREFEAVGVDTLLLQFSPMLSEVERFAEQVIPLVRRS